MFNLVKQFMKMFNAVKQSWKTALNICGTLLNAVKQIYRMHVKNKFIGFRLSFENYLKTISLAERLGVSISDLVLSSLLPEINKQENILYFTKPVEQNGNAEKHITDLPEREPDSSNKEDIAVVAPLNNPTDVSSNHSSAQVLALSQKRLNECKNLKTI